MATQQPLALRFVGALVEQLGAQLYPSATATVAELISNAWDADAKNVWVQIPFGESWTSDSEIIVVDDGHGMTHEEAQQAYLIVGRRRRVETGRISSGGRLVHGRKGIGKLAAFGTAGILECATSREGEFTTFRLDYDAIRKLTPDKDYLVEQSTDTDPVVHPDTDEPLPHGTRIRLTKLWLKRALSQDQFMRSMSRRFAISANEMKVYINGVALERFSMKVEFRFPRDGVPEGVAVDEDGWARETLEEDRTVRWWIGFTEKPLDEEQHQGLSVLANGKMVQRPFKFARAQGTEGQLGQEYLVGEVDAAWIDEGLDVEDDLIQSNRDQLQLEDARLESFLNWGRQRLAWALRHRNRLRSNKALEKFSTSDTVDEMLQPFTTGERRQLMTVAATLSRLPEMTSADVDTLMREVVNARSDVVVRQLMERIDDEDDVVQERMWELVHEFGLIDARKTYSIIEARLTTISKLKNAIRGGVREVPEIHYMIKEDAWLLDPRWDLLDDEVDVKTLGVDFVPEKDETGDELDFLFVLQPSAPAPIDEVVVVEIKRGSHKDGSTRRATDGEVHKFHGYVLAVKEHYDKSSDKPRVRGLMIAQDYTAKAKAVRESLEQVASPKLEFKTWERVIEDTERMHLGWLQVSRRRARGSEGE